MDGHKFDELTRALAGDTSRRGILKGFAGSALGGALALVGLSRGGAVPAGKVGICHRTGSATNPVVYIEVSPDAIPDHAAHGDLVSCPGAGFIDPATCTCLCPLDAEVDCENLEVVDVATCACVCNATCDPGFTLDPVACTCDCLLDDEDCPNLEVVDEATCSCFCPVEDITCPEGSTFNPDTCACDQNPDPSCTGATCATFVECESNPACVCGSIVGGGGICAPAATPCSSLARCFDGLCAEGSVCVADSCCTDPVCVPLALSDVCREGGSFTSSSRVADDGPTLGQP